MTISTETKKPRRQFPWKLWLKGTPKKPVILEFGKDIPKEKKPAVFTAQLHEWAKAFKLWVYTSVAHDKNSISIYCVPEVEGQTRPASSFSSPKKETQHGSNGESPMAKKKAAPKSAKPSKKTSKKGKVKKGDCT